MCLGCFGRCHPTAFPQGLKYYNTGNNYSSKCRYLLSVYYEPGVYMHNLIWFHNPNYEVGAEKQHVAVGQHTAYRLWNKIALVFYGFLRAAITTYHRPGGLNNKNVCLTVLELEVQDQSVSMLARREGSVPGLSSWLEDGCFDLVSSQHSLCVSLSKFPPVRIGHQSYWIKAHLKELILT